MALEDVIKNFEQFSTISNIVETMKKDATDPDSYNNFAVYGSKYRSVPADATNDMALEFKRNPVLARENAEGRFEEDAKSLAKKVEENYKEIVPAISQDNLFSYAMSLPNKDRKYLAIKQSLENGDFNAVRKAFAEECKDKMWQEFLLSCSKEFIERYVQMFLARKENEFINKTFCDETKNKEGKKEYKINRTKIESYIGKNISEQKDKTNAYIGLAQAYAQTKADADKKKKK